MSLDTKEIFEYLGVEAKDIDSIDKFKELFEPEFIRKKNINDDKELMGKVMGRTMGSLLTSAKAAAKKYGIEFSPEEIKEKSVSEIHELALDKLVKSNLDAVTELQGKVGMGKEEAIKELESKYSKIESKYKDTESLLKSTTLEYNQYKESSASQIKGIKLNTLKESAFGKLKFKSNITDIEKFGFNSIIDSKYKFDLDDKGELFVADKEGNRIKSEKVTGTFKNIDEVLQEEAVKSNVYAINPKPNGNGSGATNMFATNNNNMPPANGGSRIKLHPNAMR